MNQLAASIVGAATDEDAPETEPVDERQDGKVVALTEERRREIAKKVAAARWAKATE